MSAREASAESVAILEEGYQSLHGRGYYTAYLDASKPDPDSLKNVLIQMATHITAIARERYIRWILVSRIELADWSTRRLIAEIILKRWEPFLLEKLRAYPPALLANHLSELINLVLSIDGMVGKMLGRNADSLDSETANPTMPLRGQRIKA